MSRKLTKNFEPSTAAEREFFRQLKKVAEISGRLVEQHAEGAIIRNPKQLQETLDRYAKTIEPWARRQAQKLLVATSKANKRAYGIKSKQLNRLFSELAEGEVGASALALLNEQVRLITSIPVEAGLRAQEITFRAVQKGLRAENIEDEIREMGESLGVTVRRAKLIARTETARSTAAFNEARAKAVGSQQYAWRNSGDAAVREAHRRYKGQKLDGMVFSWNDPPTLDDGTTGHPGTFPNCRCFAEPIFGD